MLRVGRWFVWFGMSEGRWREGEMDTWIGKTISAILSHFLSIYRADHEHLCSDNYKSMLSIVNNNET